MLRAIVHNMNGDRIPMEPDGALHAVILAGGEGTRFHPLSTRDRPKQFLSFFGKESFLQQTFERVKCVVPPERCYVMTNVRYTSLVKEQLPELSSFHIVSEYEKKNTAPAIAYVTRLIQDRDPHAVIAIFPSDHMIDDPEVFQKTIRKAALVAKEYQRIVTIGIAPTWASPEYGYIQRGHFLEPEVNTVCAFHEKPDQKTAEQYLQEKEYFWNSGMFLFPANLMLQEIRAFLPELYALLSVFELNQHFLETYFKKVESLSLDYGVIEKSSHLAMIEANFSWSDIGTWKGLNDYVRRTGRVLDTSLERMMLEQLAREGIA